MAAVVATTKLIEINKAKDFAERVVSTFIEAEIGLGLLDWINGGINLSLWHQIQASLGAAAIATAKVLFFQYRNNTNLGSAVPGVIETKKEV
jgi:hypothetical protein